MGELSNEDIIELIEFYKQLGVSQDAFISNENIIDIFTLLKIKPEYDENGVRRKTPYEIIGIPPKFDDSGKEIPIFIFIKKSINKIKTGLQTFKDLKYKKKTHEKLDPIIEMYKREYEAAVRQGNLLQANNAFDMLEKMTGGNAKKYLNINFDYLKFYKSMQKQLLIDIFSHYFLLYISLKKSLIKEGIIKKDKKYKPFKEEAEQEKINNFEKIEKSFSKAAENLGGEKIKITSNEGGEFEEMQTQADVPISSNSNPIVVIEEEKEQEPKVVKIKKHKKLRFFNFKRNKSKQFEAKTFDEKNVEKDESELEGKLASEFVKQE